MKRTLSFMVMALALLLTQCRKPEVKFPTPSSAEGVTVSMTVTAGPGSKTDITTAGAITWSDDDKLYVGFGGNYVGCLELAHGGSATGTFTGNVTLPEGTTGENMFGFFYLGNAEDYSEGLEEGTSTEVAVSFATQEIYADANNKLVNASKYHVGYGSAKGTVAGNKVTGINVTMVSKVAIAYFDFKNNDGTAYTGALTLSGTGIYNKMRVNFNSTGFDCEGIKGDISLTNTTTSEKYVMLVPAGATAATLNFGGAYEGTTTLGSGIEANKFYRMPDGSAIEVKVEKVKPFTVGMDNGKPRRVEFSPGNLQYLGNSDGTGTWRFAEHQWDYMGDGPLGSNSGNVDLTSLGYTAEQYNYGSGEDGGSETDNDMASARDLFGWGATGYKDTRASTYQTNYQPYSTSKSEVLVGSSTNYYGYGPDYDAENEYGLSVEYQSDWGCVTGLPSAGEGKTWRTLSKDEWAYLLNTGNAESGARTDDNRFAKARVNDVNGMLIFPDGYSGTAGGDGIATVNSTSVGYPAENIPDGTWTSMETAGVVFLPAAGNRNGNSLKNVGTFAGYWSISGFDSQRAYFLNFTAKTVNPLSSDGRFRGFSVRMVR